MRKDNFVNRQRRKKVNYVTNAFWERDRRKWTTEEYKEREGEKEEEEKGRDDIENMKCIGSMAAGLWGLCVCVCTCVRVCV